MRAQRKIIFAHQDKYTGQYSTNVHMKEDLEYMMGIEVIIKEESPSA